MILIFYIIFTFYLIIFCAIFSPVYIYLFTYQFILRLSILYFVYSINYVIFSNRIIRNLFIEHLNYKSLYNPLYRYYIENKVLKFEKYIGKNIEVELEESNIQGVLKEIIPKFGIIIETSRNSNLTNCTFGNIIGYYNILDINLDQSYMDIKNWRFSYTSEEKKLPIEINKHIESFLIT